MLLQLPRFRLCFSTCRCNYPEVRPSLFPAGPGGLQLHAQGLHLGLDLLPRGGFAGDALVLLAAQVQRGRFLLATVLGFGGCAFS